MYFRSDLICFSASASSRRDSRRKETRARSRGRSTSRPRQQDPIEEAAEEADGSSDDERRRCDEGCQGVLAERQEASEENVREGAREPNDSNSTLENARED